MYPSDLLTETDSSQHTEAALWWKAGGEQRLQDVVGEGERDHGLVRRVDDQHGNPQSQEPEAQSEGQRLGTNIHLTHTPQ